MLTGMLNLGFDDGRRGMSEGRDVSLTIFLTSMSGHLLPHLPLQKSTRLKVGV